jgi:hypothetical protein
MSAADAAGGMSKLATASANAPTIFERPGNIELSRALRIGRQQTRPPNGQVYGAELTPKW